MNPHVSVIIPAHNSAETIGVAIQSMLDQTHQPLEIIIVDDHSTDTTKNVVEQIAARNPTVFYYSLPWEDTKRFSKRGRNINAGYLARNYGFTLIKGDWITFQDADDASLLNRIEIQLSLAQKYQAHHICIDWQYFDSSILGKRLDVEAIMKYEFTTKQDSVIGKDELYRLSQQTKGFLAKILGPLNTLVPFEWKQVRFVTKLFMYKLDPYPGTGNSPLFKREVIEKVRFRKLSQRIWPSFVGRGADRDFNFQVAETFRNSFVFRLPLYLWRVPQQNPRYEQYQKYLKV